jgi:hypothetical protein
MRLAERPVEAHHVEYARVRAQVPRIWKSDIICPYGGQAVAASP